MTLDYYFDKAVVEQENSETNEVIAREKARRFYKAQGYKVVRLTSGCSPDLEWLEHFCRPGVPDFFCYKNTSAEGFFVEVKSIDPYRMLLRTSQRQWREKFTDFPIQTYICIVDRLVEENNKWR